MASVRSHTQSQRGQPEHDSDETQADQQDSRSSRSFGIVVTVAVALAVALRFWVILRYYRDLPLGFTDNYWYHSAANLLADGHGFVNPFLFDSGVETPSAGHPPLYSMYLAVWSLFGADTALWHRLASGIVSSLAVIPLALVARQLAGKVAGLAAAFGAAVYPPMWLNDGLILSESLYVTIAALILYLAYRFIQQPGLQRLVPLVVALSLGALTRSEAVLLFVTLLVPIVLMKRDVSLKMRVGFLSLATAIAAVMLAPWVIRNLVTFEQPTFLASGAGIVLELGNCDETYSGTYLGYWTFDCERTDWFEGDESEVSGHKASVAREYIWDHLDDLPKVAAARIGRVFGVFRPFQTGDFDVLFERRTHSHVFAAIWLHWFAMALAIAGTVMLWRRGEPVFPAIAMVCTTAFVAAVSLGITRYRIGADPAILLLASVAAGFVVERIRQRFRAPVKSAVTQTVSPKSP